MDQSFIRRTHYKSNFNDQMLTFVPATISGANGYGLGTMRFSVLGTDCYGHTGNIMGYTSVMIYSPLDSVAICLMMNINLSGGNIGKSFLTDVIVNNPTGINNSSAAIPQSFSLYQNYPNPFNPETNIRFDLSAKENVKLSVINILGEEVSILYKGILPSGEYSYKWDAVNFRVEFTFINYRQAANLL